MTYTSQLYRVIGIINLEGCLVEVRKDGFYYWNNNLIGRTEREARESLLANCRNVFSASLRRSVPASLHQQDSSI